MAFIKCSGGALRETVLWENPNPSSGFEQTTITFSESFLNYLFIRFYWKAGYRNDTIAHIDFPSEDIRNFSPGTVNGACRGAMGSVMGNYTRIRVITCNSDDEIIISRCCSFNASGTENNAVIPIKICGLKK